MKKQKTKLNVEVSARHIHLSQKDLEKLFGKGYKLKKERDLSQPGQFACKEKVSISNDRKFKLRILGPVRDESQIEISRTEALQLGIQPPLRLSGDLKNVATRLEVIGPKGKAKVKTIIAKRHLHCSPKDAKKYGLRNNQKVKIEILGERGLIFDNVIVRVDKNYVLTCHIDTDEGNAAGVGMRHK